MGKNCPLTILFFLKRSLNFIPINFSTYFIFLTQKKSHCRLSNGGHELKSSCAVSLDVLKI